MSPKSLIGLLALVACGTTSDVERICRIATGCGVIAAAETATCIDELDATAPDSERAAVARWTRYTAAMSLLAETRRDPRRVRALTDEALAGATAANDQVAIDAIDRFRRKL